MAQAIKLARKNVRNKTGGPFGCVIIKNNKIIARGQNRVTSTNDPTAHAEVVAIRRACKKLKSFQLTGCTLVSSCEPCPMCLGAIYWARPKHLVYASNQKDAAKVGFDDQFIYEELARSTNKRKLKTTQILHPSHLLPFQEWTKSNKKIKY